MFNSLLVSLKGILLAVAVAFVSIYLTKLFAWTIGFNKSPVSPIIVSIVLGILIGNLCSLPKDFSIGFNFCLKRILKLGIVLLGIRLSVVDVINHASATIPLIIVCIVITLLATYLISKKLSIDTKFSMLTAIGTSICGVTAIVATAPIIKSDKEQTAYAIANITLFGLFAMLLYPALSNFAFSSVAQAGYFLGTAIHETSQVAGAGLIYAQQFGQEQALDIATITKLLRNSMMLFIIPMIAYVYHRNDAADKQIKINFLGLFPYFILGFLAMAIFRTIGDNAIANSDAFLSMSAADWQSIIAGIKTSAEILLTVAMACVGLTTNCKSMVSLGLKPLFLGLIVASITGMTSFFAIKMFYV